MKLSEDEQLLLKPLCLITAKLAMYVANVKEDGFTNNPHLEAVKQHAAIEGAPVVAVCAIIFNDRCVFEIVFTIGLGVDGCGPFVIKGGRIIRIGLGHPIFEPLLRDALLGMPCGFLNGATIHGVERRMRLFNCFDLFNFLWWV